MKSLGLGLLHLALLTMLLACGKENKSGKTNSWDYSNPYVANPNLNYAPINSPYTYGQIPVNNVITQNACRGYGGFHQNRIQIQIPLTNFPTVIPAGDVYVGVTSYGDVAVLAGQATGQPPIFVGYMCQRSFAPTGQGQLMGIKIGSYSKCSFKPITAATMVFPGGATAEFRWMDGGSSQGPFPPPLCLGQAY